jgi:tetratricopeptide (TPR) repeat protein
MLTYNGRSHYLLTLCQYVPNSLPRLIAHYERQENRLASDPGGAVLARLLYLIKQVGEAVSALHMRNMAHGALIPGNILLTSQDRLLLADSGLARLHTPAPPYQAPEIYTINTRSIQAGNMSAVWNAASPASDQYMLGVLCQQLFARLLQPEDYKHLQPVLLCATNQQITRRFASIDIFIHELTIQGNRSRAFPASSYTAGNGASGIRQSGSQPALFATKSPPMQSNSEVVPTASTTTQSDWYDQMLVYHPGTLSSSREEDWEKLGGKHFAAHNYEAALKAYLRAMEIDTGKAALWLALGDTYFAMAHYAEALKTYEQALMLNPDDANIWNNRGATLDALGRHKEAAQCYDRAEQLSPA